MVVALKAISGYSAPTPRAPQCDANKYTPVKIIINPFKIDPLKVYL